jgi:predicted AAA+ superfamily ATPase
LLKQRGSGVYYNWDETTFRRQWIKDPSLLLPKTINGTKPIVILDELHKAKLWKRSLKGLYDTQDGKCDILVTGSARLNIYRKGSDSLLGRYYNFRLHPFSVAELLKDQSSLSPDDLISVVFSKASSSVRAENALEKLFKFGPFPEPLFAENQKLLNLWQRGRIEKIIREDLRDLSRLPELSQVEMLASLLPERASQPLSIQSLSEDLEVAYTTVKRWLNYLSELYYFFGLKPYAKSLSRAIRKENKLYLWDWSEIENKGARFENLVASHLLKYCDFLTDTGVGNFELRYLKNKEKYEIDFLILRDKKVFLAIEAKYGDEQPSLSWAKFLGRIDCHYGVQLVMKPNVFKIHEYSGYKILVISAASFLQYLV